MGQSPTIRVTTIEPKTARTRGVPLFLNLATMFIATSFIATLFIGCRSEPAKIAKTEGSEKAWFRDVASEVGLDFIHDAGPTGSYFMPQIMGSGTAVFDFDNDGLLDVYLLQNAGPKSTSTNRLYQQLPDGHFKDVSAGSGLDINGFNMGVAIGDINNDGNADVLVTSFGSIHMFMNHGDGKFEDVTKSAGLDNVSWGTSASFLDYDRDGWLDLVVVNYVDYDATRDCLGLAAQPEYCHPKTFANSVSRLFHNLGGKSETHAARFEDVTIASGMAHLAAPGLGVVCADFDGDGWQDIFIANDNHANHLWINRHNGAFEDEALERGLAFDGQGRAPSNMGIAIGDINDDGLFDIIITHMVNELHNVWKQGPRGMFREQTIGSGLSSPSWRGTGFGTVLADFDLNGDLDLAVVNGAIQRGKPAAAPDLATFWRPYAERNQMFAGDPSGRFRDISKENSPFCGTPAVMRGLATGDLNRDGALDLIGTTIAGPSRIYRNVSKERGHWLSIRAIDWPRPRDAYGAEITVVAGARRWVRWLNPGSSYLCSNAPNVVFGLGSIERVDSVSIQWPDGETEVFPGYSTDQSIVIRKGDGTPRTQVSTP